MHRIFLQYTTVADTLYLTRKVMTAFTKRCSITNVQGSLTIECADKAMWH